MKPLAKAFLSAATAKFLTRSQGLSFFCGILVSSDLKQGPIGAFVGSLLFESGSFPNIKDSNEVEWIALGSASDSKHIVTFNGKKVNIEQLIDLVEKAKDKTIVFIFDKATSSSVEVISQGILNLVGINAIVTSATIDSFNKDELLQLGKEIL